MNARLMIGDVRQRIKEIPDGCVDLVCTSPPFLALRKYGDNPEGEMGSEATPAEFIDGLLSLTAEFRRVLAPHGSIAVELGDTFSGSGGAGGDYNEDGLRAGQAKFDGSAKRRTRTNNLYNTSTRYSDDWNKGNTAGKSMSGIPMNGGRGWPLAKSLCLTPYLYPTALAYGRNLLTGQPSPAGQWMVRNMIAWARPNPPVGDLADKVRPGTSYITVATTSPRRWFDLDAVRTPLSEPDRVQRKLKGSSREDGWMRPEDDIVQNPAGAPPLDWWDDDYDPADPVDAYTLGHMTLVQATQPYKGAHYATWPKALAQRLVLMMCPPKVCTVCGVPSERITERSEDYAAARAAIGDFNQRPDGAGTSGSRRVLSSAAGRDITCAENITIGWTECNCAVPNKWRQGCVLDPFAGSGTTLAVATGCGRDAIGIELYEANAHLIRERVGMFLEEVA